ncbi:MAG: ParB/RepB/Spo0J family partition protein [Planctomycetales bacterium]
MTQERRLGRGLEALLGTSPAEPPAPHSDEQAVKSDGSLVQVNVYQIDTNPYQPRTEFDEDEIEKLSSSLSDHGLLQPVVVRRDGERFQLISGERRWRAAIRTGWSEVPAIVREVGDRQVAEMTIVENLQRKDLGPLDKATSFQQYLNRFQCTQEELAKRLSVDRSTVANLIRLLELPATVQQSIRQGDISAGHGRALLPLGDETEQVQFAGRIKSEQLSVRATERLVGETIQAGDGNSLKLVGSGKSSSSGKTSNKHLAALEQEFRAALGTRVQLQQTSKGRGKITIHFNSHEEFERLRDQLAAGNLPQSRAG